MTISIISIFLIFMFFASVFFSAKGTTQEHLISAFANGIYTIKIYNARGDILVEKLNVLH